MRLIREYKGKRVRQTICVGDQIAVILEGAPGQAGERLLLPLADYLANLQRRHEKKKAPVEEPDASRLLVEAVAAASPSSPW